MFPGLLSELCLCSGPREVFTESTSACPPGMFTVKENWLRLVDVL